MSDLFERPWGWFRVLLNEPGYKVKLLLIHPQKSISKQWHHHRSEYWQVLKGGVVAIRGSVEHHLGAGDSLFIQKREIHRLTNMDHKPVHILEIQRGTICEETDIVRLSDG